MAASKVYWGRSRVRVRARARVRVRNRVRVRVTWGSSTLSR